MTTATPDAADAGLRYEPPGPGSWVFDADHQSTPRGRLMDDVFLEPYETGFRHCFERYGLPLETIQARSVEGWFYMKPKVAGAPDKGGAPPPDFVMKLITRLAPEMRRRNRAAKQAIDDRLWLRDARQWESERASWIERCDELGGTELANLDLTALAAHVRTAFELAAEMMQRHFELIGPALGVGRLLNAADEFGLDVAAVRRLLAGASPASAGTVEPLRRLQQIVEGAGADPTTLEDLRGISDEAAALVDDYMRQWGWRVLADDIEGPTLAENPDHLLGLVRGATADPGPSHERTGRLHADLRQQVPAGHRARFDQLVEEARSAYGSLDDNSGVVSLSMGLARRAAIEVAERAAAGGRLEHSGDVWNLTVDELTMMAGGGSGPGVSELRRRRAHRLRAGQSLPPMVLGDEPHPPPDPAVFPTPMGEMAAAIGAFITNKFGGDEMGGSLEPPAGSLSIDNEVIARGHAVGTAAAVGRIIVATDPGDALDRLEPGDLLVCDVTTPAWNSIFPLLGGIVTAHGGPLGHTAVMAREFDLPAVVGVGATDTAWDGRFGEVSVTDPK